MSTLNETPRSERVHIAFFGRRNSGKSSLTNAFAGHKVALVSDVAGTTTDPVTPPAEGGETTDPVTPPAETDPRAA